MKKIHILMLLMLILSFSCKEKIETNRVDMEQIKPDESTDYEYIFKDRIQNDEEKKMRYKKKEF
jgi:hypothetical protein